MKIYNILDTYKNELLTFRGSVIAGGIEGMKWLKGTRSTWKIIPAATIVHQVFIPFCVWWLSGGVKQYQLSAKGMAAAQELARMNPGKVIPENIDCTFRDA